MLIGVSTLNRSQNLISSDSIRFLLSAELKGVYSFVVLEFTYPTHLT